MTYLIPFVQIVLHTVRRILRVRKFLFLVLMLIGTTQVQASGGFWSPPRWAEDLKKQSESQQRQVERMSEIQQDVTAGARDLVAADATARKDWVTLQNQIELTRSDLTAQNRAMQEAHSRLEEERRVMEGDRRFDLLSSSVINALGSILACLVPLLLVGWLLRRQDQNEEPTLLPELYCERPTEIPSHLRSLYLNDQLTHSDNNDFYHEENS